MGSEMCIRDRDNMCARKCTRAHTCLCTCVRICGQKRSQEKPAHLQMRVLFKSARVHAREDVDLSRYTHRSRQITILADAVNQASSIFRSRTWTHAHARDRVRPRACLQSKMRKCCVRAFEMIDVRPTINSLMDTLGLEPEAFQMRGGCDTTYTMCTVLRRMLQHSRSCNYARALAHLRLSLRVRGYAQGPAFVSRERMCNHLRVRAHFPHTRPRAHDTRS